MAKIQNIGRSERGPSRIPLYTFATAAVVSQLLVLRYLHAQWPPLDHPLEPPTSNYIPFGSGIAGKKDGFFNNVPVYYHPSLNNIPPTTMQCMGENFEPDTAWMFRSCRFRNLCYDVVQKEFVYIQSKEEADLNNTLQKQPNKEFMTITTLAIEESAVSLGAFHPQMSTTTEQSLKWFPRTILQADISAAGGGYYALPPDVAWVPLLGSTLSTTDPTDNLIWRDLFPIYTLLSAFGLADNDNINQVMKPFLFLLNNSPSSSSSYASGLELFGSPKHFITTQQRDNQVKDKKNKGGGQQSPLVCAKEAVAGIGMIADRGFNRADRWTTKSPDYIPKVPHLAPFNINTHNMAQGSVLKEFRDYMLHNLGAEIKTTTSSNRLIYTISFYHQAAALDTPDLRLQMSELSSNMHFSDFEPMKSLANTGKAIAASSALVVQCCDEDAALVAAFLADNAFLVIFYDPAKYGVPLEQAASNFPAWDLIDNTGYIRTQWISIARSTAAVATELIGAIRRDLVIENGT